MSHEFVYETGIRKVPRRTWSLPRWAWHVFRFEADACTGQRRAVWRTSGYTRTWLGAAIRVSRQITDRKDHP